ncbi:hotdog fold thioesterase [Nocardioides houyundeii]|uniref:hotdog fold thioesterase n=1 Tax=Nocardioides houyundeii TaxID=2045452 RepID=UPI0030843297
MTQDQEPAAAAAAPTPTQDDTAESELLGMMRSQLGALNAKMGVELLEISAERLVATMPVEGNTQPYGLLHGGASVVLAETLGSMGAAVHAHPDRIPVGVDINATHHRSARSGTVTGVATAIHLGRTSAAYEIVISDEQGRRLCTSRITCALIPADRSA